MRRLAGDAYSLKLPAAMFGLRNKTVRRFGATLAALAVYLQLAFATWGMLAVAAPGAPADGFSEHALCLAAGGDTRPTPADRTPAPPMHDHLALCCVWHTLPALAPQAMQASHPVAYAGVARAQTADDPFTPAPRRGPGSARAPPSA